MGRRIEVVVTAGPDTGKRYAFAKGPIRVGRGSWPQVSLDDDGVSRKHLIIHLRRFKRFEALDMSTGGTYVNNQRIRKATLPLGTVLKLGGTMLRIGDAPGAKPTRKGLLKPFRIIFVTSAAALVLAILVLVINGGDTPEGVKPPLADPVELIQNGCFEDALDVLKNRVNHPATGSDKDAQLYAFVVRLRDRREAADRFEAGYKLDAARDVWLMLRMSLPDEWNELREWIQEQQIDRIERRMENVGQLP